MIEYIQNIVSLSGLLFYVLSFCFLYIPLFNKCNIKKIKHKKNGKKKTVSEPNTTLAFIYLTLLYILFKCFTFKMIIFFIISLSIASLVLVDGITTKLNKSFYPINKFNFMILAWKILHTVFTVVDMITNPVFSKINNYLNNKLSQCKEFITQVADLNLSDDTFKNLDDEFLKMSDISNMSNMSNITDYVFESNKKNKIIDVDVDNKKISDTNLNVLTTNNVDSALKNDEPSTKQNMEKKIDEINKVYQNDCDNMSEEMILTISEVPK